MKKISLMLFTNHTTIDFNVLCALMKTKVIYNMTSKLVVIVKNRRIICLNM